MGFVAATAVIIVVAGGPMLAQESTDSSASAVTGLYRLRHQTRTPAQDAAAESGMTARPSEQPEVSAVAPSNQQEAVTPPEADTAQFLSPALPPSVRYEGELLTISAENSNLSAVIAEVQRLTGAEFENPAPMLDERIVVHLGPAPAAQVLAALLAGSVYDFVILNSKEEPTSIERVLLMQKKRPTSQTIVATAPASVQSPTSVAVAAPKLPVESVQTSPPTTSQPSSTDGMKAAAKAAKERVDEAIREFQQKASEQNPLP